MIPDDESDSIPWLVCLSDTPITTPRDYTEAFIWLSTPSGCPNSIVIERLEQEISFRWLSIKPVSLSIHSGPSLMTNFVARPIHLLMRTKTISISLLTLKIFNPILSELIKIVLGGRYPREVADITKVSRVLATKSLMTSFVTRPMHSLMRSTWNLIWSNALSLISQLLLVCRTFASHCISHYAFTRIAR